jgi:hypothetical protein
MLAKAKLALARIIYYGSFTVLATVITIVNYNCSLFIVEATGRQEHKLIVWLGPLY